MRPRPRTRSASPTSILLNKTDLVSEEELAEVERRIRAINPHAIVHRTERCAIPLDRVLDRGAFDLERILSLDPDFLEGHDHDHDHDMITIITITTTTMTTTIITPDTIRR